jgi:hypothetical protein
MPEVCITIPQLAALTGRKKLSVAGDSVAAVLASLQRDFPGFAGRLLDEAGKFRSHIMVVAEYGGQSPKECITDPQDRRPGLSYLAIVPISCGG